MDGISIPILFMITTYYTNGVKIVNNLAGEKLKIEMGIILLFKCHLLPTDFSFLCLKVILD